MMTECLFLFRQWQAREAAWWQFWRPQSGTLGGMIMGVLLGGVFVLCRVCVGGYP